MTITDFSTTLLVDQTPEAAFAAINDIPGWWCESFEGRSQMLNDEFSVRFNDVHYSRQKLTDLIPGKKVVWDVIDSKLTFIADTSEWTGTKIIFEISRQDNKTAIRFTHTGLVPETECYDACSTAWTDYIQGSLLPLISTGIGQPFKINKTNP